MSDIFRLLTEISFGADEVGLDLRGEATMRWASVLGELSVAVP